MVVQVKATRRISGKSGRVVMFNLLWYCNFSKALQLPCTFPGIKYGSILPSGGPLHTQMCSFDPPSHASSIIGLSGIKIGALFNTSTSWANKERREATNVHVHIIKSDRQVPDGDFMGGYRTQSGGVGVCSVSLNMFK